MVNETSSIYAKELALFDVAFRDLNRVGGLADKAIDFALLADKESKKPGSSFFALAPSVVGLVFSGLGFMIRHPITTVQLIAVVAEPKFDRRFRLFADIAKLPSVMELVEAKKGRLPEIAGLIKLETPDLERNLALLDIFKSDPQIQSLISTNSALIGECLASLVNSPGDIHNAVTPLGVTPKLVKDAPLLLKHADKIANVLTKQGMLAALQDESKAFSHAELRHVKQALSTKQRQQYDKLFASDAKKARKFLVDTMEAQMIKAIADLLVEDDVKKLLNDNKQDIVVIMQEVVKLLPDDVRAKIVKADPGLKILQKAALHLLSNTQEVSAVIGKKDYLTALRTVRNPEVREAIADRVVGSVDMSEFVAVALSSKRSKGAAEAVINLEEALQEHVVLYGKSTGKKVANKDLSKQKLDGINFQGVEIIGFNFADATLEQCSFKGAIIDGETLKTLLPAIKAAIANGQKINLDGAILTGDLSGLDFSKVSLRDADLSQVTSMQGADLTACDAKGAKIPQELRDGTFMAQDAAVAQAMAVGIVRELFKQDKPDSKKHESDRDLVYQNLRRAMVAYKLQEKTTGTLLSNEQAQSLVGNIARTGPIIREGDSTGLAVTYLAAVGRNMQGRHILATKIEGVNASVEKQLQAVLTNPENRVAEEVTTR